MNCQENCGIVQSDYLPWTFPVYSLRCPCACMTPQPNGRVTAWPGWSGGLWYLYIDLPNQRTPFVQSPNYIRPCMHMYTHIDFWAWMVDKSSDQMLEVRKEYFDRSMRLIESQRQAKYSYIVHWRCVARQRWCALRIMSFDNTIHSPWHTSICWCNSILCEGHVLELLFQQVVILIGQIIMIILSQSFQSFTNRSMIK